MLTTNQLSLDDTQAQKSNFFLVYSYLSYMQNKPIDKLLISTANIKDILLCYYRYTKEGWLPGGNLCEELQIYISTGEKLYRLSFDDVGRYMDYLEYLVTTLMINPNELKFLLEDVVTETRKHKSAFYEQLYKHHWLNEFSTPSTI